VHRAACHTPAFEMHAKSNGKKIAKLLARIGFI